MANHTKKPKIKVNKIMKKAKFSKLTLFNTILLLGLYYIEFGDKIELFTKGILIYIRGM